MVLHDEQRFLFVTESTPQTQSPIGSFESHLSYDIGKNKRLWASLDGNFWFGGTTSLNGIANTVTRQTSSRIGGTFSFPVSKHQSIKIGYSDGAYVRFGGNYQSVSAAWQYSWIGKPEIGRRIRTAYDHKELKDSQGCEPYSKARACSPSSDAQPRPSPNTVI